ncbi:MAG: hypothetical protein ACRESR_02830 [Gammaproteobacteria bacterium]
MQKIIFRLVAIVAFMAVVPLFSACGDVSHPGKNYYASIDTVGQPDGGDLVAELTSADTYFEFSAPNDKYAGPFDPADPGFPAHVQDQSNRANDANHGFPLVAEASSRMSSGYMQDA